MQKNCDVRLLWIPQILKSPLCCFRAARHGLNMDGKLARLRKQDEQLLATYKKKVETSGMEN